MIRKTQVPAPAKPAATTSRRKFLTAASGAAAGAATLGFPMIAKGQTGPISMRWQSTWPAKDIFHEYALDYAKKVNDMTGGDLKIEVLPAGAVVPAFGLLDAVPKGDKGRINFQMKMALDKVAFLPFGLMIDKWRWDVFSGKTPKSKYNEAWWALRTKYQGITPASPRSEQDFDPGAKMHVPGSTPYIRYFLARIYQFQFHRALCKAAGHKGSLDTCSIYGNKDAGAKLKAMLELGQSKPWPEALAVLSGETKADASALVEYFAPLRAWLKDQNKGEQCGW